MVGSQYKTLTASPKNTRKRQRSEEPETTVSVKRRIRDRSWSGAQGAIIARGED